MHIVLNGRKLFKLRTEVVSEALFCRSSFSLLLPKQMEQAWYGSWLRLEYLKELWARDVTIELQFVVGNLFAVFFAKDEHCNPAGKNENF